MRMASKRAPSATFRPGIRHDGRAAQTRRRGAKTRAPEKSDSHQVRNTLSNSPAGITSPSLSERTPKVGRSDPERGADHRADDRADDECQDVPDAFEVTPPSGQVQEQQRCDDDLER